MKDRQKFIQDQIEKGGLTVEKEQELKNQYNTLSADVLTQTLHGQLSSYQRDDTSGYNLSMVHLQGQRERANILPFSPGNVFGIDLRMLQQNQKQLGTLQGRASELTKMGLYGPEQRFDIESKEEAIARWAATRGRWDCP